MSSTSNVVYNPSLLLKLIEMTGLYVCTPKYLSAISSETNVPPLRLYSACNLIEALIVSKPSGVLHTSYESLAARACLSVLVLAASHSFRWCVDK